MVSRGIRYSLLCAGVGASVLGLSASEKIKFSAPSQGSAVATEARDLPRSSPNLFDKFRSGGADALMQMPQQPNRSSQAEPENKKDWIFATPEGEVPSAENMFKSKSSDSKQPAASGLADYVAEVERRESESQQVNVRDKEPDQASFDNVGRNRNSIESSFSNPNPNSDPDKFGKESFSFSEYWKETTGMNPDRFAEQADLRRAEFQQIFETRSTVQQITTVDQRLPGQGNLLAPARTDFSSRTSQSSVSEAYQSGYMPMNGGRNTAFDDVNARALGRDTSSLNSKIEQPRVLSQPAVLPFPARPGELFKRPGSY